MNEAYQGLAVMVGVEGMTKVHAWLERTNLDVEPGWYGVLRGEAEWRPGDELTIWLEDGRECHVVVTAGQLAPNPFGSVQVRGSGPAPF